MLYTFAIVLIFLWLLGIITANTMGGIVHILLVIAVIMLFISIIQERRQ